MTRIFRHIVAVVSCICCFLAVSCQKAEPYRITPNDLVFIRFNTAVIDGGSDRSGDTPSVKAISDPRAASEAESVHTLRVVIVSQDKSGQWTVETNEFYADDGAREDVKDLTFAITDGRKKKVYLFANCDINEIRNADGRVVSLGDPDAYKPDATGKVPVMDYRFTWKPGDKPAWIPMSAVYDLDVPEKENLPVMSGVHYYRVEKPLYLVRGVTKISFSCKNTSASRVPVNIQIRGWRISAVAAGESYLLAHVADNWRESTKPAGNYVDWKDWLVAEAQKTRQASADPKDYEWLTAYDLPESGEDSHKDYGCEYPNGSQYYMYAKDGMNTLELASHYLPESKYVSDDGVQHYMVTFTTWEWEENASYTSGLAMTYTAELPYLYSLFRNTEVRLSVGFTGDAVALEATVCPWTKHTDIEIPPFE